MATGAVSSRAIASNAVGTTELAVDSMTASRITAGAVGTSEIADGTVDEIDLADGAITNVKLASGNVQPSRLAGQFGTYSISASVGGNSCVDYEVPFGGDVNANDLPLVSLASGSSLPANLGAQSITVDGKSVPLTPGMGVTAEIKTSQRRVIEYFLSPLLTHTSESLRER